MSGKKPSLVPDFKWQLGKKNIAGGAKDYIKWPNDVTFIDREFLVVTDSEGHRLLVFHVSGKLVGTIGDRQVWPNGVAMSKDNHLLVTDRKTNMVKVYDIVRNQCLASFGWDYDEDEVTSRLTGVAVNSSGEIYVTDTGMNVIHLFNRDGIHLGHFGTQGNELGELSLPFYIATDHSDHLYVSDNMNYCVKYYDPNGNYKHQIGSGQEWGKRQFQCPYGLTVDHMGRVVVADHESGRVAMYDKDGTLIQYVLAKNNNIVSPCGIAMGGNGHIVVTEASQDYANVKMFQLLQD